MSDAVSASLREPNDCGCCEGVAVRTPGEIINRPGLAAIAYRVGTHATFRDSLIARLSSQKYPAVVELRTRDSDDFSIALLDAWATVADVLTFYQERIANESFLRTATERGSIVELARLIGYEPRSGVAASTALAFTVEGALGSPRRTTIDIGAKVQSIPGPGEKPQTFETIESIEARVEWNALRPALSELVNPRFGSRYVYLKGTSTNLKRGDALLFVGSERENDAGNEQWDFRRVTAVTADHEAERTRVEWAEGLGTVTPRVVHPASNPRIFALRLRASLFGYNAPHPATLSNQTRAHYGIRAGSDWSFAISGQTIDLDAAYPAVLKDSWLVLSRPDYQELYRVTTAAEAARAKYAMAGKTTRINLDTNENLSLFQGTHYRDAMVFAQSEPLEIAAEPIVTPITGATIPLAEPPLPGLVQGQLIAASGIDAVTGNPISEVVEVSSISGASLTVTPPLSGRYVRSTFAFNANVARATHGESVTEILGSGNAGEPFQRFVLRQPPLTYISASNASGARSTLRLYVDDVEWHETPTLYGSGPLDRVFVTRSADDGRTTVQFGDGQTGARLPTGQDNVRAMYRTGIGRGGLVRAEQLTLLMTRPLGVKAAINPQPATDGDDREMQSAARLNAPLTVLALDRTVSLQDYEDFTRAFAGIAKALATWSGTGRNRGVFLTVAGPGGAAVNPKSELYANLLAALAKAGDPHIGIRVESFRLVPFFISGGFRVEPDHVPEKVKAAVDEKLRSHFSFDARSFGQSVTLSEVIAVIQNVPGVVMVDIDDLQRTSGGSMVSGRLRASMPVGDNAAELLTLDSAQLAKLKVIP